MNDPGAGHRRAQLALWYDSTLFVLLLNNLTPSNISNSPQIRSDNRMREVLEQEVFPNRTSGTPTNIPVLDSVTTLRSAGPYNYNTVLTIRWLEQSGEQLGRDHTPDHHNRFRGQQH